jgi:hypothetical protein
MSSFSSQDSTPFEQEFIDLFGRDQLSNVTWEQFVSLNAVQKSNLTVKVNTKKSAIQDLSDSDSDNSTSNDKLYNKDFSCTVVAKSKYTDNKADYGCFIKLYYMYIGNNNINIDSQSNTILKNRHSLIKKSDIKIELKRLRAELNHRYQDIVTVGSCKTWEQDNFIQQQRGVLHQIQGRKHVIVCRMLILFDVP